MGLGYCQIFLVFNNEISHEVMVLELDEAVTLVWVLCLSDLLGQEDVAELGEGDFQDFSQLR